MAVASSTSAASALATSHVQGGGEKSQQFSAAVQEADKSKPKPTKTEPVKSGQAAATCTKTVTVEQGNTLWGLAKENIGQGSQWPSIYQDNKAQIANPNLIYPGQSLTIRGAKCDTPRGNEALLLPQSGEKAGKPEQKAADKAPADQKLVDPAKLEGEKTTEGKTTEGKTTEGKSTDAKADAPANAATDKAKDGLPLGASAVIYGAVFGPATTKMWDIKPLEKFMASKGYPYNYAANPMAVWIITPSGNITDPKSTVSITVTTQSRLTKGFTAELAKFKGMGLVPYTNVSLKYADFKNNDYSKAGINLGVMKAFNDTTAKAPNVLGKAAPLNVGLMWIPIHFNNELPGTALSDAINGGKTVNGSVGASVGVVANITGVAAEALSRLGPTTPQTLAAALALQGSQQIVSPHVGMTWRVNLEAKNGEFTGITYNGHTFHPGDMVNDALGAIGLKPEGAPRQPDEAQQVFPGGVHLGNGYEFAAK